jgi:hypothetical protein
MSEGQFGREGASGEGILTELTVFAVLGAGFLGLFAGVSWFWAIWVFGFAVVLPVVSILEDRFRQSASNGPPPYAPDHHEETRSTRREKQEDALETLKRRYAEGEIGEAEFEHRLEALVENEDVEDVRRRYEDEEDREFEYEME